MLSLKMALRSISSNKMRAVLTMLGIIIGVFSLVVLVSLVNGATSSVTNAVSDLGSDMLTATINDSKGMPLTITDLQQWAEKEETIEAIAPYSNTMSTGKYGTESASFTVYGITYDYFDIQSLKLLMGRSLRSADVENHTRVCVLNNAAALELIGYEDCVGEEISLDGLKFTVVGVLEKDESLISTLGFGSYMAYIPYTTMYRLSPVISTEVHNFAVSAAPEHTMAEAEETVKDFLYDRFGSTKAYSVISFNMMEEAMGNITSVLSILLGGIAAISLVVGGIGIMNIMLVTVTERTREIGIRKAIGATRSTILRQFLMEAVVLCMMGCAIGIFLSWTVLRMAAVVVSSLAITFELNKTVCIISVIFCFFIGIIFGLYPANKAAKMKPIDALHYGG